MAKFLTSNKILADAVTTGIKALEEGNYQKSENFLQYAYDNNPMYKNDQFILYALTIAHYNLGNYDKTKEVIEVLQNVGNLNEQISTMVNQILNDYKNIKNSEESEVFDAESDFLELLKDINLSPIILQRVYKRTGDKIYNFLLRPDFASEKFRIFKRVIPQIENAINAYYDMMEMYYSYDKNDKRILNQDINIASLYELYSISINNAHSLFLIKALGSGLISDLLVDKRVPVNFKNELLFDLNYYTDLGYIDKRVINYLDEDEKIQKVKIKELANIDDYIKVVEEEIASSPIKDDAKLHKYIYTIAFKYLLQNYIKIDEINISELMRRIYQFIYQTHVNLEPEITNYFEGELGLELEDEKDIEIYQIVLSLEKFMI